MNKEGINCVCEGFREDRLEARNGVCNQGPRGGTEIRDSVNKCLRAWKDWPGEPGKGCDMKEWNKNWQSKSRKAKVSRGVRTGQQGRRWQRQVRSRLEEPWQKQPHLGRMSTDKFIALRSLEGKGNFTPTPAISKHLKVPLGKKYLLPCVTDSYEEYKCHQSLPEIQQNFPYCSQSVKTCQWATQLSFSTLFLTAVGN